MSKVGAAFLRSVSTREYGKGLRGNQHVVAAAQQSAGHRVDSPDTT